LELEVSGSTEMICFCVCSVGYRIREDIMASAEDVDYSTVRLKEPMDEEGAASFKVSLNLGLSPCASFVSV
jgi:hypothetical protein